MSPNTLQEWENEAAVVFLFFPEKLRDKALISDMVEEKSKIMVSDSNGTKLRLYGHSLCPATCS